MDLNSEHPTIWQLNGLLKRNKSQYPATYKAVNKLQRLKILKTKDIEGSPRGEKGVYVNKESATIYGDDEFRKMMLDEWDGEAKRYIEEKLKGLLEEKGKVERRLMVSNKGRMVKNVN